MFLFFRMYLVCEMGMIFLGNSVGYYKDLKGNFYLNVIVWLVVVVFYGSV